MKGTYVFAQGGSGRITQTMILDDLRLYIPQGPQYELATFEDEKTAAQAFNRVMMARFTPKAGWRILEKRMGEALAPPPERMVGYVAPAVTSGADADLDKSPIHIAGDHVIIAVETATDADMATALGANRASVRHLCLYARFKATAGLAALLKNPWPGLQTLVVDAFDQTVTRQATCKVGDLAAVLPVVPDVGRLYVAGQIGFGTPVKHARLSHLSLMGNPLPAKALEVLARSSFPALTHVDFALATEAAPDAGWQEAVLAFLNNARALEILTLEGPFEISAALRALSTLGSKAPRELRVMGHCRDDDDLLSAVAELARTCAHVGLALPEDGIGDDTLAALRKVLPNATRRAADAFLPGAYGAALFVGAPALSP